MNLPTHLLRIVLGTALLACLGLSLLARAIDSSSPDEQWRAVQELPHRAAFTVVDRDFNCSIGEIRSAGDSELVIKTRTGDVRLDRANILTVNSYHWNLASLQQGVPVSGILYSGRSSWFDVMALGKRVQKDKWFKVRLEVKTADGKLHNGRMAGANDNEIQLSDSGKGDVIRKSEITRVSFVREKPLSDAGEYWWDEATLLQIFDPEVWPRLFRVGDTMSVRLYDVSMPQENSPVTCK